MTSYVQMTVDEFREVLDGCEKMSDVTAVQRTLADDITALLDNGSCTQEVLDHIQVLSTMAINRFAELGSQGKF